MPPVATVTSAPRDAASERSGLLRSALNWRATSAGSPKRAIATRAAPSTPRPAAQRRGGLAKVRVDLREDPPPRAARQQHRELVEVGGDRVHSESSEAAAGASTASTALRNARQLATRSRTACTPVWESRRHAGDGRRRPPSGWRGALRPRGGAARGRRCPRGARTRPGCAARAPRRSRTRAAGRPRARRAACRRGVPGSLFPPYQDNLYIDRLGVSSLNCPGRAPGAPPSATGRRSPRSRRPDVIRHRRPARQPARVRRSSSSWRSSSVMNGSSSTSCSTRAGGGDRRDDGRLGGSQASARRPASSTCAAEISSSAASTRGRARRAARARPARAGCRHGAAGPVLAGEEARRQPVVGHVADAGARRPRRGPCS